MNQAEWNHLPSNRADGIFLHFKRPDPIAERIARRKQRYEYEQRLRAAREFTGAKPVRLHHMPLWFKRIAKQLLDPEYRHTYACDLTYRIQWKFGCRMDHWGSSDHGKTFVSEPYGGESDVLAFRRFADLAGLKFRLSAASWWNPGQTIRLELWEAETLPNRIAS